MSFLDTITDGVSKIADTATGESSLLSSFNLLDNASTMIIDSMKSLPGANEMQNLGFPQFEELLNPEQKFDCQPCDCQSGYEQMNFRDFLNNLFGNESNPMNDVMGGGAGYEQSMGCAFDLLSRNPADLLQQLLRQLGLGRDGGSGGGDGGGFFGGIFNGIKGLLGGGDKGGIGGILGGILGGGEGGGLLGGILGGGAGGLLGGILGGGEGGGLLGGILGKIPGMDTLLPLALKVAPYVLI